MEVEIISYHKKGYGQTQCVDGHKKVLIPCSVIGDKLQINLLKNKKGKHLAEIVSILQPSRNRVQPRCRHVGSCGGCSWQQLEYLAQLKVKQQIITELFSVFKDKIQPITASPRIFNYRNKMEFTFSQDAKGRQFLGLIAINSRGKVLNVRQCTLCDGKTTKILEAVRQWWQSSGLKAYHPRSDQGTLRNLIVRYSKSTDAFLVMLTVSGNPDYGLSKNQINSFTNSIIAQFPLDTKNKISVFLRVQCLIKGKPTQFFEKHLYGPAELREMIKVCGKKFHCAISPSSFFQPNAFSCEPLLQHAIDLANPQTSDRVLDLYCGTAILGMVFSPFVREVVGIEENPYAVCDAELNIETNAIANMHVYRGDVTEILADLPGAFDIILVDPPRAGLSMPAIEQIRKLSPKKIIYISCHPQAQKEDLDQLIGEYHVSKIQPVDQFPHTPHIENILLLRRATS